MEALRGRLKYRNTDFSFATGWLSPPPKKLLMTAKDPETTWPEGKVQREDARLLAALGYKEEFKRAFKPIEVFGNAFSIIGLAPSIASVLFYAIPNGGGPAMVWGWLTASIFMICVGMSMAELASAAPTSGGLYYWTYSLSSPRWKVLLCWIVGYSNTIGNIASVTSIDWGCAIQIMAAVTIASDGSFSPTKAQLFAVYCGIVVTHSLFCCLATQTLARLQKLDIMVNIILCLTIIVTLPAATPAEFRNSAKFALGEFVNFSGWPDGFAFVLSFLAPLWTICSFDSAVHISEEASNAATSVPWAIVSTTVVGGVLGTAVMVALAFCMGNDLQTLYESDQPMALIFVHSIGPRATLAIWVFIILVQFMMGSSMLLASSRQTFAFSRDQALPFSNWLYRMNAYTGTPVNSVWYVSIQAIAMALLVFVGDQAIDACFAISTTGSYVAYAIPIAARWLGQNDFKPGPFNLKRFSLPCAIVSVLSMMFFGTVFLFPPSPTTTAQDMNYSVVVLGGVLGLSLLWYYLPVYGGRNWFAGPVKTVPLGMGGSTELDSTVANLELRS